jgi:hypothetical protein
VQRAAAEVTGDQSIFFTKPVTRVWLSSRFKMAAATVMKEGARKLPARQVTSQAATPVKEGSRKLPATARQQRGKQQQLPVVGFFLAGLQSTPLRLHTKFGLGGGGADILCRGCIRGVNLIISDNFQNCCGCIRNHNRQSSFANASTSFPRCRTPPTLVATSTAMKATFAGENFPPPSAPRSARVSATVPHARAQRNRGDRVGCRVAKSVEAAWAGVGCTVSLGSPT